MSGIIIAGCDHHTQLGQQIRLHPALACMHDHVSSRLYMSFTPVLLTPGEVAPAITEGVPAVEHTC
jgi:hypothetical protein